MDITLFYAPVTCSRVSLVALEHIGAPYALNFIDMASGQNQSEAYRRINAKAKVPALVVDGRVLTETPAILTWLDRIFPDADLLPHPSDLFEAASVLSDMNFCSSGLHPIITRLCRSQYFCDTAEGASSVYHYAQKALVPNFELVDRRLATGPWLYGERWSIVDAYLNWIWYRASSTEFDLTPYVHYARHARAHADLASVRRADEAGVPERAGPWKDIELVANSAR